MNIVDVVLGLALAAAAARGFARGALSQAAAFGGAAGGLVLGATYAPRVAGSAVSQPGLNLALLTLGLLLGAVLVGQAIGVALGARLRAVAAGAGVGAVDRGAGIAVGVAGLVVAVWLLGSVLVQGPSPAVAREVRGSAVVTAVGQAMPPPPDVFGRVGQYLDNQGFPTVVSGLGDVIAPPVDAPPRGAVAAAQAAGAPGTVQVLGTGCGGMSAGSGFVSRRGYVVTNAHVVAGADRIDVRAADGRRRARPLLVDTDLDLAVLSVDGLEVAPLRWADQPASRGTAGATLGFPGGRQRLVVKPAAVRASGTALGRDVYGRGSVERDVLTLAADVRRGDSGGPFVTRDGRVAGVVFAAAAAAPRTGYALTAEQVRPAVDAAIRRDNLVATGACRF